MNQGNIGKFVAIIRRKLFEFRLNREIYSKVFPHLNQVANYGYPFHSKDEMAESGSKENLVVVSTLRLIEQTASKMPKAKGDAFRYTAYRDLNERMWMYLEFASQNIHPANCDPRYVATRAPA